MTESWSDRKQDVGLGVLEVCDLDKILLNSPNYTPKTNLTTHPVTYGASFQSLIETLDFKKRPMKNISLRFIYLNIP